MDILKTEDLINQFIEIEPVSNDGFFKIRETLTRMRTRKS
jgi:hypothetical protein